LSFRNLTRPRTGSLKIPVVTSSFWNFTWRGRPTFSDNSFKAQ